MTPQRPIVLFIDDEERIVRSLMMLFRARYDVRGTTDPQQALDIVQRERVHVVVSDQRMPVMYGHELLRRIREIAPATMRILLTGYSELDAIVNSVNEGEIFRFVNKPWRAQELGDTVDLAARIALETESAANEPVSQPAPGDALRFLVIDQDESTFKAVAELIGDSHVVRWGASVPDAFEILAKQDTAVVISEVRVGDDDVAEALKELKRRYPEIVTIVLTSFRDTGTLIELINQGRVYRFLPKPLRLGLLEKSLQGALSHYRSGRANPVLLKRQITEAPAAPAEARISKGILGYFARMRA
jgi:DNA-binding NtrC family response regulator